MLRPSDFGAPSRYDSWRKGQYEALMFAHDSPKRFVMECIPTGIGKSLIYSLLAIITRRRTVCLTSNRGLQDQLMSDFEECGMVDVRGQSNYPCQAVLKGGELHHDYPSLAGTGCDHGPCHSGIECSLKSNGCDYYDAVRIARSRRLVSSNYSWWLSVSKASGGGGIPAPQADLLILDEAHAAPEELARAVSISISNEMLSRHAPYDVFGWCLDDWQNWATSALMDCRRELDRICKTVKREPRHAIKEIRRYQDFERQLRRLDKVQGWIPELQTAGLTVSPTFPRHEAESWLFRGAKKVLLISASVRRKTAFQLGIRDRDLDFFETDSDFPVDRRPIYAIPSVGLKHDNTLEEQKIWSAKIDKIIQKRPAVKGLIHTVSYERSRLLKKLSKEKRRILTHTSNDLWPTLQKFKTSGECIMLASPSISTGFNFSYCEAETQIISKIPFLDTRSLLTQARIKEEWDYDSYATMQEVVQMAGRIMRAPDDRGETFIVDSNFEWFIRRFAHFAPRWFLDALRHTLVIPPAPPCLTARLP